MTNQNQWPFPNVKPEEFYKLDPELQNTAARMAEAYIKAHFQLAAEDAIEKARTSSMPMPTKRM